MRRFVWMAGEAWWAAIYYWPLTLPLFAAAIIVIFLFRGVISHSSVRIRLWLLAPFSVPFVILSWGTAMAHTDALTAAPRWPLYALLGLLVASLVFFAV